MNNIIGPESKMMQTVKLVNSKGMELEVCNYGATLMALKILNKNEQLINVIVGLPKAEDYANSAYQKHNLYLGSSIGRYAGRISKGSFSLDGKKYPLETKSEVHLHGGSSGFDKMYWDIIETKQGRSPSIKMQLQSGHMEGGYPGNVTVTVQYELLESNALRIVYSATTDRPTVLNLTNHAYFNLDGEGSVSEQFLQINSGKVLELDEKKCPTGRILPCSQTHYDFQKKSPVKHVPSKGLDDVYVLSQKPFSASLISKKSGICMKVLTKQPAMVVFTPLHFPDIDFYQDTTYSLFPAICFETQNFPDAPNHPHFPNSVLKPGETYHNETVFDFSAGIISS
ncbi:MAG: aldose epimerase family protein [Bacteroidota bacterium]